MRPVATVLLLSTVLTLSVHAVDWPTFHLKPTHTGFNKLETTISASNVKFLTPAWAGIAGDTIDFSSPVIVGNSVYMGSSDGNLYVFNSTGCGSDLCNALWTGAVGGQIYSSPAVANGIVYVGSNNHILAAFPAAGCGQPSCSPLWTGTLGGAILE
jgi:outer membrane protein assembly factor BamB